MPENTRPIADGPVNPADLDPTTPEPDWDDEELEEGDQ